MVEFNSRPAHWIAVVDKTFPPRHSDRDPLFVEAGMRFRGYSAENVFSEHEQGLLVKATVLVERVFAQPEFVNVRCHELARAVGTLLSLEVEDGFYGFVDHSWLWTKPKPSSTPTPRLGFPNILDVYCVGGLPMVRLVACDCTALPHVGWAYRPAHAWRRDIDEEIVSGLINWMDPR